MGEVEKLAASTTPGSGIVTQYPIRWTEHVKLTSLEDIEGELDEPVRFPKELGYVHGLTLTDHGGRGTRVKTGRQHRDLLRAGNYAVDHYNRAVDGWFRRRFGPLLYLREARPARVSFVQDFVLNVDPLKKLPPTLVPDASGDDFERVRAGMAKGMSWQELFPETEVLELSKMKAEFVAAGVSIRFFLAAWADFDGDGIEDVLLHCQTHWIGGTLGGEGQVVLTRLQEGARLVVVRDVNPYYTETTAATSHNARPTSSPNQGGVVPEAVVDGHAPGRR